MKLSLAIGSLLLSMAGSASAALYSFLLPLSPSAPYVAQAPTASGLFTDDWYFQAPLQAASTSGSVISVDIRQFFNIDNIQLSLRDAFDNLVALGAAGEGSSVVNAQVIGGADYYFRVSGEVRGAPAGFYVFTAAASPLLEPGALSLVCAALAAAGLASRRRTR